MCTHSYLIFSTYILAILEIFLSRHMKTLLIHFYGCMILHRILGGPFKMLLILCYYK